MPKSKLQTLENDVDLINAAFDTIFQRPPSADEVEYGIIVLKNAGARHYFCELLEAHECSEKTLRSKNAPLFVYPGHYYSPICDVKQLQDAHWLEPDANNIILGVDLATVRQQDIFYRLSQHFDKINFRTSPTRGYRYYVNNDFYGIGDALILSAFIREFKPSRLIEVGSGFSSAVILDTLDQESLKNGKTKCTFIEPYSDRLKKLLLRSDLKRVSIIEKPVQDVALSLFEELVENDILFLDTTHVSRTGSDVNHEVFEILPRLQQGVIIHFHDFFNGFEYPREWVIDQNRSWNEAYLLRAFLMYNTDFEVLFFNHHFVETSRDLASSKSLDFVRHPGGGLWLRKL